MGKASRKLKKKQQQEEAVERQAEAKETEQKLMSEIEQEAYSDALNTLAELAGKVYVFAPYKDISLKMENVEVLPKPIKAVSGGMKANKITLTDGMEVDVDGLFCLRNAIAPATLLGGLELDGAHIVVDREMKTNIKGVFAAGDITGRPYQIAKAVGEGNVAAHGMLEML